ncbi:large subunit GTPase 1 homolog [Littorina saxatilis]|uniref:Large subunit GTPase 1 homolog n=1 Tax=Littorina saxatilis TaxID=31220 RepID=A0AAN9AWJ4_9CAEN
MGRRKKEANQMGKALIKDRFRGKKTDRGGESFLHTTQMNDGGEYVGLNLQSVTEQTSLDDFLTTAELAGRDFAAEKENVSIITNNSGMQSNSKESLQKMKAAQNLYKDMLRIPRRPPWTESTSADKLREDEHISFLEWRRQLGRLTEEEHIIITPYEKNLEFWRQLWRVIERSDVVVQIVDARNPLLFWCPDLDKYVKEVDKRKRTLLLINKADYLTFAQRKAWAEYFSAKGVQVVFWSAKEEAARLLETNDDDSSDANDNPINDVSEKDSAESDENADDGKDVENKSCDENKQENDGDIQCSPADGDKIVQNVDVGGGSVENDGTSGGKGDQRTTVDMSKTDTSKSSSDGEQKQVDTDAVQEEEEGDDDSDGYETEEEFTDDEAEPDVVEISHGKTQTSGNASCDKTKGADKDVDKNKESVQLGQEVPNELQSSEELLTLFRKAATTNFTPGVTTVGMVGYPNVGKSSTINTILQTKKVPVSATPGRTKHFQTLFVEKDLMLCDCPGLVFPSFVNSKAELVVNGILPIDQLIDSEPPVSLVCERIGREAFQGTYNINLPPPEEWEDPDKGPGAYELLHHYGLLRGFMSHKGNPDRPRAARYILKDYVNGKLLFCHPPPGIEAAAFQKPPYAEPKVYKIQPKPSTKKTVSEIKTDALDREFFDQRKVKAHAIGPRAVRNYVRTEALQQIGAEQGQGDASGASTPHGSQASLVGKPWKKHNNRNKKEKLRRVYADHDCY